MTERVLLPSNVIPSHYELEFTPNLESLTFEGVEVVHVDVKQPTSGITLHTKELVIKSAIFSQFSSGDEFAMTGLNYVFEGNVTTISFGKELPCGSGKLSISFSGVLNGDMAGFSKSEYTDIHGKKKVMASTQFEALDARRAFPCWDEPALKCTFDITLIIPSHLSGLSNMPELKVTSVAKSNLKRIEFERTPKMSTYLVAFAVGEFDYISGKTKDGVLVRVITPPGRSSEGKFALNVGIASLEFYNDFFQVPYPLPKLDMICITEFAMGAMENWGLVTYREVALMIDDAKASSQSKQRVAIVVAHELAHQWFGNLVTMSWWDGLWLNEGFAAFMEHFCVDALFPEYSIWEQFTTDAFGAAQRLDALRSSHPIIVPIKHAEEVEQVFDAISYCKGSCVVNMIYHTLGFEHFRDGLRNYMKKHAYGNTETIDLWNAWTEVSGIDVSELMSVWTKSQGYPVLSVTSETWSSNSVTFTLQQQWFLSDGSMNETDANSSLVWSIPLSFATSNSVSDKTVIMNKKEQSFTISLSNETDFVKINAGQKALARVIHSEEMLKRIASSLKSNFSEGRLSDVDLASLILDLYACIKAKMCPLTHLILVLKSIDPSIRSLVVWSAIQAVFGALNLFLEEIGGNALTEFRAFAKKFIGTALRGVGWDTCENDGHTDKLVRATIINLLDTFAFDDEDIKAECKRRFDGHFETPSLIPSEYKITLYKIVLMNGGKDEYEKILNTFRSTDDNQERKYAMFSLGATLDMGLKMRTLDWAVKSGEVKLQDFFYPMGSVTNNAEGADLAWSYFQNNFDAIKLMLSKASPSLMDAVIVNCTNRFCSESRAREIEEFFAAHSLPQSSRKISQILEVIRANSAFVEEIRSLSDVLGQSDAWN